MSIVNAERLVMPEEFFPWGRFLAFVRTIVALGTLSTLTLTPTSYLFQPLAGMESALVCDTYTSLGLYCVVGEDRLGLGVALSVAVLVWVVSGFVPVVSAPLHFYVTWSFANASTIPDGGDQLTVFLTFFIMLMTLGDWRWNHWRRSGWERMQGSALLRGTAFAGLLAVKLQMSYLYLNSAIGKMGQEEWANGTHMYYTSFGYFAPGGWRGDLFEAIVSNPVLTFTMTWGVVALEFMLGLMLLVRGRERVVLFWMGIALHAGIAFWLAIASFQVAMLAGLLLLAVPSTSAVYRRHDQGGDTTAASAGASPVPPAMVESWQHRARSDSGSGSSTL